MFILPGADPYDERLRRGHGPREIKNESSQAAFSRTALCVFVGTNVWSRQDKLRTAEEQQQQEED